MQFIFHIELIRQELQRIQDDLSLLVDYSRYQAYGVGFRSFEKFLRCKIAQKQQHFQLIYEMYSNFQNSFGFSIVAVLLMVYVRVLIDSYFSYYNIYLQRYILETIMLAPSVIQIPIFLIISKSCMDVVKFITLNLHSIISQFNEQNSNISIQ
ncbi:gustatory receptor 8a-like, partial [Musca vetustissima]|uniref:gustatory receptor 8a-like n=1 Tax=Musca vetustissima TaxID=27455 RepID=UPI002AB687A7